MTSPERLAELIRSKVQPGDQSLLVIWHVVEGSTRREFGRVLENAAEDLLLVTATPNDGSFLDANVLANDVLRLIGSNKDNILIKAEKTRRLPAIIVVLSRRPLRVLSVPSPATLPDWFPELGGKEVMIHVEDLTIALSLVGLDGPELMREELARKLLALEQAVLLRLEREIADRPKNTEGLFEKLGIKDDLPTILERWRDAVAKSINNPGGYRLEVGNRPRSLLAALVSLVARSTPDQLYSHGDTLIRALGISTATSLPSMLGVMFRPTSVKGPAGLGQVLLVNVFAAYNLMNGVAHAGSFPKFSVSVLENASRDMQRAFDALLAACN